MQSQGVVNRYAASGRERKETMKLSNKDKRALVNGVLWLACVILIAYRFMVERR